MLCFAAGSSEEYKLLEQMNKVTLTKYVEMKQIASNISKAMKDLNEKCKLSHHTFTSKQW